MVSAHEEYLTVAQAAQRFPGRPHHATVWRWVLRGTRGVRLPSVIIGGRRYVRPEDIEAFIAALNAPSQPAGELPASVRREHDRAEKLLTARGL